MFRSAERTFRSGERIFRSGERIFRSGERTFRTAEYKPNTVQRYIKTEYYANIYTTVFIHLPLFNRQRLFSTYYSLTRACAYYNFSFSSITSITKYINHLISNELNVKY